MCTTVLIGWDPPPPLQIWAHIRGRHWSAKINDISSLWPLAYLPRVPELELLPARRREPLDKLFWSRGRVISRRLRVPTLMDRLGLVVQATVSVWLSLLSVMLSLLSLCELQTELSVQGSCRKDVRTKEVIKEQPPARNLSAAVRWLLQSTNVVCQRPSNLAG